jgi:2-oxoisovalerate dehydrogenase E1 component alpha subunit
MVMARAIERRVWVLNRTSGQVVSMTAGGAEGVQVAAAAALHPGSDWVVPHAGDLALCLAMGVSPLDVMLAVFGRAADPSSGGRQQPMSFGSKRARIVTTSAVPAVQVVHAAGIAYASRLRALDEVTLVSIDQRDADAGDWHEGLNFAAVHRLPVVCLVLDATYRSAPLPGTSRTDLIAQRAQGYGMAGESLDGSDFRDAFETISRAVERARAGDGPTLVHARIPDLSSRSPRGSYRRREELEAGARQDPIDGMRHHLRDSQLLDEAGDSQMQADCMRVVEGALDEARQARAPEPAQALDNVFAT